MRVKVSSNAILPLHRDAFGQASAGEHRPERDAARARLTRGDAEREAWQVGGERMVQQLRRGDQRRAAAQQGAAPRHVTRVRGCNPA
jgi:hypothetical protein